MDSEDAKARSVDGGDEGQAVEGTEPAAAAGSLATDVRSVSAAREADGVQAWEAGDRLARLALLVTGSPDRAYRLTRESLIAVGRDGQYVQARRKLLRKAVRMRVDPYTAGLLPGLGGLTPAARLWRRLMALPAVERALVVLTEAEGMADAVAGAVLGLPRGETEKTLARVRQSLESQAQLTEAERREVFEGPALLPANSAVPAQALTRALRGRRRARLLTAVVAAVVLVGGGTSAALALSRGDSGGEGLPQQFTGDVVRLADPSRWQARGDLLGDRVLLRDAVKAWRAEGFDAGSGTPTVVWAGRLDDSHRLVVLTGLDRDGTRVLGALVDNGEGMRLAGTRPAAPTVAIGFSGLDEQAPSARRFLVAPWVSKLALNDVAGAQPTGAQEFRDLALHDGLSDRWERADASGGSDGSGACGRPLLRLSGADPTDGSSGAEVTQYALDADDAGVPVSVADAPPQAAAAQAGYFAVLRGLAPCAGGGPGGSSLALAGATGLAEARVSELHVLPVWSGRLPDRTAGQVMRLSWRVSRPDTGVGQGIAFALVHRNAVRYSTARFVVEQRDLDTRVDTVLWPQAGRQPGFVVLTGGPGVAKLDVQPRPKGFRPGGPVAFLPSPKKGQKMSVLGLDRGNRLVSAQPVDF